MENEWRKSIQDMIDWIDNHIEEEPTLDQMSKAIGYSKYYCSSLFHKVAGTTLKKYLADRKLTFAATSLRDSHERILDIALKYGYASQEALTRAFVRRFGCTPNSYRKHPKPMTFSVKKQVLYNWPKQGGKMSIQEIQVRVEHLPAHKYIGIWEPRAKNYGDFFKYHDCDEITGIVDSLRHVSHDVVGCHMAGWQDNGYFYGLGVDLDYDGEIPAGFELREVEAASYMVFYHPAFDFVSENIEVMSKVEKTARDFDLNNHDKWWLSKNFEWLEDHPSYQRHFPEVLGYEVLKPIKRKD